MSKKSSLDPRVRRTRKWLQQALLALMAEKSFSKITIAEITDRAELSRPTFYLHYKTKRDVIHDYLDGIYASFMEDIDEHIQSLTQGNTSLKLFEHIRENAVPLSLLANSDVSNLLMEKLHQYNYEFIRLLFERRPHLFRQDLDETKKEFVIAGIAGSIYAISLHWLQTEIKLSPTELSELTMRLIIHGVDNTLLRPQE